MGVIYSQRKKEDGHPLGGFMQFFYLASLVQIYINLHKSIPLVTIFIPCRKVMVDPLYTATHL